MAIPAHLDFATEHPRGAPRLLIEAKRISRADPGWAAAWRSNLLQLQPDGLADAALALVTVERIFVWPAGSGPDAQPSFVLDAAKHLGKYFERMRMRPEAMTPQGFERVVSWWLGDLTDPRQIGRLSEDVRNELRASGLLAALEGARLIDEASAQ